MTILLTIRTITAWATLVAAISFVIGIILMIFSQIPSFDQRVVLKLREISKFLLFLGQTFFVLCGVICVICHLILKFGF